MTLAAYSFIEVLLHADHQDNPQNTTRNGFEARIDPMDGHSGEAERCKKDVVMTID